MAESFEAIERRKARNKVYAKERWEKIKADRQTPPTIIQVESGEAHEEVEPEKVFGLASIKAPTLKVSEKERMDKIVVEAYRKALEKGKTDEAEMMRNNPLNAGIEW